MHSQDSRQKNSWVNLELEGDRRCWTCRFPECRKIYIPFTCNQCTAEDCQLSFHNTESRTLVLWISECATDFVIADIPGLIEGASEGVGLGHEFLRHIERTKMMIHVVDAAKLKDVIHR